MIEEALKIRAGLVDEAIPKFLPITPPDELYYAMRHLLDAGGKRLRPSALLLAAEAVGGRAENMLPAAVAVELVHNFTLIHDDIMDEADIRRGLATVHKKWGVPRAIIAGDALYSKAFEILSCARSEPSQIAESIELLSKTCTDICEGQWMDMNFQIRKDVAEQEYIRMVEKKTAVLFAAAMKIGAILSGANRDVSRALWDFGCRTGVGFQIYDDVIDLITPEEILGKAQGGDIIEGKRTLIVIHALSKGATIDALGKSNATRSEISAALSILKESGSIDYAMNRAVSIVEAGKSALRILPDSEAKSILIGLADYMIERKY
ncbi:geranylgeranyl pyrophosphate synthase [Candidatus Methanoperedens nitroreducens]|uniref:Geranylgeranyl pyrophosphate synthase n=1 Tax=Candidatus Methanoperedens nitratireducens TaxID=1392998 RepID=A0A062VD49_9EURY|nr:polyprenyl synthetase family protein [Candidatus Methanoperedens nitroreducens]KCZ73185.1 geranylgeranyl pyrophosphate synthase [Candidatus Methanoperedens nitroreducens]MDJ1422866.1 polyprenyl synthetase family protein [Candidatus Methanoperedens sp.]